MQGSQSAEKSLADLLATLALLTEHNHLTVISAVHHQVHLRKMWEASYKSPEGADVADNAAVVVLLRVGVTLDAHFVFQAAGGGDLEVEFFEGPDVSAVGNNLTAFNLMRSDAGVPNTTAFQAPTIGGGGNGIRLSNSILPGGTKAQAGGALARTDTEWNLAAGTDYLLILTNRAGQAKPVSIICQWYDHE